MIYLVNKPAMIETKHLTVSEATLCELDNVMDIGVETDEEGSWGYVKNMEEVILKAIDLVLKDSFDAY